MDNQTKENQIPKEYFPIYKSVPPYIKFTAGHGFKGVILENKETGKIQCHLCGTDAFNLSKHLFHKHKDTNPIEYRKNTGLGLTTPLMSTRTLKKIKNNFLNLTQKEKDKRIKLLKENNKKVHSQGKHKPRGEYSSTQYENKYGTCEVQAKDRFYNEYNKFGKIPSWKEMSSKLRYIIENRFGSYGEALKIWGIDEKVYKDHLLEAQNKAYEVRREADFFPKYDEKTVKNQYTDFFLRHKRLPTWGEVKSLGLPSRTVFVRIFGRNKSEIEINMSLK